MAFKILLVAVMLASSSASPLSNNPCETESFNGMCYWSQVHDDWDITFAQAQEICENQQSSLAVILNPESYQAIMENLRVKIPFWTDNVYAWIGNTFDPLTEEVSPPNSFITWYPWNEPRTESESWDNKFLHLYVNADPSSEAQGMGNIYKEFVWPAAVCQFYDGQ